MAEHRGRINAVMIGVGAAFDYHAGTIKTRTADAAQRAGVATSAVQRATALAGNVTGRLNSRLIY
ncbi:MAG: hypothetical protein U1F63_01735 [Chitinivorax sp.]